VEIVGKNKLRHIQKAGKMFFCPRN